MVKDNMLIAANINRFHCIFADSHNLTCNLYIKYVQRSSFNACKGP